MRTWQAPAATVSHVKHTANLVRLNYQACTQANMRCAYSGVRQSGGVEVVSHPAYLLWPRVGS